MGTSPHRGLIQPSYLSVTDNKFAPHGTAVAVRCRRSGGTNTLTDRHLAQYNLIHLKAMLAKFEIEYVIQPQHNKRVDIHRTDDPVEAEGFLMSLLATGTCISSIKHEGVELDPKQSDQMLRVAGERLVSRLLCRSPSLDSAAVKHRFGFAG